MEIETIKKIREKTFKLSDLKGLKVVELKAENGEDEFIFLSENLTEILEEKLKEEDLNFSEDLKVFYSLSYCQGDGFMFEGTIKTKKAQFEIKHSGNYHHENSKEIDLICLYEGNKEIYTDEFNNKQDKKADKLTADFNILYKDICKELENIGYKMIEEREQENILRIGFNDFLEQNDINQDIELNDIDYKTESKKGFIKICNFGDTSIKGLWIKNFNLNRIYESLTFKPTIRETTKFNLTL